MSAKTFDAIITSNPDFVQKEPQHKEWAILVYLAGENNLFDEMVFAIKAMKSAVIPNLSAAADDSEGPSTFNFHAMVQFAAEHSYRPTSALKTPRRFRLTPGDFDGALKKDYSPERPVSTADARPKRRESYKEELIDFLRWGIDAAPASHYMVVFSGHALAIEGEFLSRDTTPRQALTVKDLREILANSRVRESLGTRTIDILGLDSCVMSMVEVGYELRNEVKIVVASQGSLSNLGWPYKSVLGFLHDQPAAHPELLAQTVVEAFVKYYDDFAAVADQSADISAWRLWKLGELKEEIEAFAGELLTQIEATGSPDAWDLDPFAKSLVFAHWYAQTYHADQYVDLTDFCYILSRTLPAGEEYEKLRRQCTKVIDAVQACVIRVDGRNYSGPLYQYSFGISIYLPWSTVYKLYTDEQLDFLVGSKWLPFIHGYIAYTRRPPRIRMPGELWSKYLITKDSPPRSRGVDDPILRAKNPPSEWGVLDSFF